MLGEPRDNQFNPGNGLWSIDVIVNKDTVKKLKSEGLGWKLKKTEQDNPWAPSGSDYIKFKRNEFYLDFESKEQKKNKPVYIIDSKGKPWNPQTLIGNGTEVNVRFNTYEGLKKQTQISPGNWEVQVVKHVPYEPNEPFPIYDETEIKEDFSDAIEEVGSDEVIV